MNKSFPIAEKSVPVPGSDEHIVVRGLSVSDLAWLAQNYGSPLATAFDRFRDNGASVTAEDLTALVTGDLMIEGPLLVAAVIATAAGLRDNVDGASRLPLSLQLELLTAVGELTFAQEGGSKKVFETVIRMATAVTQVTGDLLT